MTWTGSFRKIKRVITLLVYYRLKDLKAFGVPYYALTDDSTEFKGSYDKLLGKYRIKHIFISEYYP